MGYARTDRLTEVRGAIRSFAAFVHREGGPAAMLSQSPLTADGGWRRAAAVRSHQLTSVVFERRGLGPALLF